MEFSKTKTFENKSSHVQFTVEIHGDVQAESGKARVGVAFIPSDGERWGWTLETTMYSQNKNEKIVAGICERMFGLIGDCVKNGADKGFFRAYMNIYYDPDTSFGPYDPLHFAVAAASGTDFPGEWEAFAKALKADSLEYAEAIKNNENA